MDAYDLMSIVKKQGAAAKNLQAWKDYQSELSAYREKKGKGSFWGGLASLAMAFAMPYLLPATAGTGLTLGSAIGKGLFRGAVRAVATNGVGDFVERIAEGKNKKAEYKSDAGFYGLAQDARQKLQADSIAEQLGAEDRAKNRSEWFTSILSGFSPEIKAIKGGTFYDKDVGKLADTSINKITPNLKASEQALMQEQFGDKLNFADRLMGETLPKGESLLTDVASRSGYKDRNLGKMLLDTGYSPEASSVAIWEQQLMNPKNEVFSPLSTSEQAMGSATSSEQVYSDFASPTHDGSKFPWEDENWLGMPEENLPGIGSKGMGQVDIFNKLYQNYQNRPSTRLNPRKSLSLLDKILMGGR